MSELKALEKLRAWAKCVHGVEKVNNTKTCANLNANAIEHANALFNDLEAEIASDYMRLPTGADGVPIHIGDVLELTSHYAGKWEVDGLMFDGDDWYFESSGNYMNCAGWSHAKSHTLEDVLREMLDRNTDGVGYGEFNSDFQSFVSHYADEIRELLRGDA